MGLSLERHLLRMPDMIARSVSSVARRSQAPNALEVAVNINHRGHVRQIVQSSPDRSTRRSFRNCCWQLDSNRM